MEVIGLHTGWNVWITSGQRYFNDVLVFRLDGHAGLRESVDPE